MLFSPSRVTAHTGKVNQSLKLTRRMHCWSALLCFFFSFLTSLFLFLGCFLRKLGIEPPTHSLCQLELMKKIDVQLLIAPRDKE